MSPNDTQICSPAVATKKILLLEDDSHFGGFLSKFLGMRGYDVTLVADGSDGVREVSHSDFDVIVCDFMMPKVSGDAFYRKIQASKPHLCSRFIFITGNIQNPRIITFVRETGSRLLAKPFQVNDLFRAMTEIETQVALEATGEATSGRRVRIASHGRRRGPEASPGRSGRGAS